MAVKMMRMANDLDTSGTSTTHENVEIVKEMIMNDYRTMIRKFADGVSKLIGSCYGIFSIIMGMKSVAAKFNTINIFSLCRIIDHINLTKLST